MKLLKKIIPLTASLLLTGCGAFDGGADQEDASTSAVDTTDVTTTDTADTADTSSVDTSQTDTSTDASGQHDDRLEYYMPRFQDHLSSFAGDGQEGSEFRTYPQFTDDNSWQFAVDNGGSRSVYVIEYTPEEIRAVFTLNQAYFRQNFIDQIGEFESELPDEILLQEPLEVGHTWDSPSGSVSEITSLDTRVDIPFGSFDAIEVAKTFDDHSVTLYFVHEIGLIKQEWTNTDGTVVTSVLESMEEQPESQLIEVFHPDEEALGLVSSEMDLSFQTNDSTREAFEESLKNISGYAGNGLIGPNVSIHTLYLNADGRAYVDFSEELVTEMNAGSGTEGLILQGIVNTIGHYYMVEEVYLTVEQQPYESGHITMEEGQFMTVDYGIVDDSDL